MVDEKLKRFLKYLLSSLVVYVVVKAPIMWLLTDFVEVHYLVSGLIAGSVPTLASYIPNEYWVWKKK